MKKLLMAGIASTIILLSGCEQKNPLIKDETVAELKGAVQNSIFLGIRDIVDCGNYYAGYSKNENDILKNKCDKWSVEEFKQLQHSPHTAYQATIDNFRDPALWQIVLPKDSKS